MADPRVAMLKAVPLFAACDDKQLAFIATQVDEMDFVAGRDLCREGASGGEFFVILTGTAEVRRQGRHLRELGPGDFFGEIALLDGGPGDFLLIPPHEVHRESNPTDGTTEIVLVRAGQGAVVVNVDGPAAP